MTDRELLEQLFQALVGHKFVQGDEASIMDMVQRYKQPPLTRHFQVVMQMTRSDYDRLGALLEKIFTHLHPKVEVEAETHESIES